MYFHFWVIFSLCSTGCWPGTLYVDQFGFKLGDQVGIKGKHLHAQLLNVMPVHDSDHV